MFKSEDLRLPLFNNVKYMYKTANSNSEVITRTYKNSQRGTYSLPLPMKAEKCCLLTFTLSVGLTTQQNKNKVLILLSDCKCL